MDVDRRSLMKGMLAAGGLLAAGGPAVVAGAAPAPARRDLLWLSAFEPDEGLLRGAAAACGRAMARLEIVTPHRPLVEDCSTVVPLLKAARGKRCVAVMDAASAAIFLELARQAGARLLSLGNHARDGQSWPVRHDFSTTLPTSGVAERLAAAFVPSAASYVVTERFSATPIPTRAAEAGTLSGFRAYRLASAGDVHLHCSGSAVPEALSLDQPFAGTWQAVPRASAQAHAGDWQSDDWAEALGYGLADAAFGEPPRAEPCRARAFVHRSGRSAPVPQSVQFFSFTLQI